MSKRSTNNGRSKPRGRIGAKALSAVAAFTLVASMCPGTTALAYANDQLANDGGALAGGTAGLEEQALSTQYKRGTFLGYWNHDLSSGLWRVSHDTTVRPLRGHCKNAIRVEPGANVTLIIDKGATLDAEGDPGYAAIMVPENSTLTIAGEGTLKAKGGDAKADFYAIKGRSAMESDNSPHTGDGGEGGWGGRGAGAGIGSDGGWGGKGGKGGKGISCDGGSKSNVYGNSGSAGEDGEPAAQPGTIIITGSVTVEATGGAGGAGGTTGEVGKYAEERNAGNGVAAGTSGGGGGGGGGSAADGIGSGGTGGGGGGGGASANIDGEPALFSLCDLDDLWGHGGQGGASSWGGEAGDNGSQGSSNGGDSTDASWKYAKSGGQGGSCAEPKAVPFYTFKESGASSGPNVICKAGHGVIRSGVSLGTLKDFEDKGGRPDLVWDDPSMYDGKPHGVKVGDTGKLSTQSDGGSMLSAQADDEVNDWPNSGTVEIDGVKASYSIAYYDEEGTKLDSTPVMPGRYAAVVSFESENPDYCGSWIETVAIAKRQVAKPTPAELTFECANWKNGEGAKQDAFPGLDEADYTFDGSAKAADGTSSLRSASAAGNYQACFKLKDPATCAWAGESEDAAECWVPWSIALQEFDPNSKEITYWGTSYDDASTTVTYTGEPQWVRPWFTPAKAIDGEFPQWFTHWTNANRPTDDRASAAVVYLQGDDDREGLVGYHKGADGTLEPVTGEQVYAWMFGVDVDGKHVDVQSGDKVWYKTGEDGWKVPLAVQGERPDDAEGYVMARDLAYADHLGVRDVGTYHAYAYFDSGAGFAPTALAEATVKVKAAPVAAAKTPATGAEKAASASATPKTGDFSPLLAGGIAFMGLIAAGALSLSVAHRRR